MTTPASARTADSSAQGADPTGARDVQLASRPHHQLSLTGAGEDDRDAIERSRELAQQREPGLARVLDRSRGAVGDDDGVGAGRGRDGVRRRHPRAELFDGGRLKDVERLPLRDSRLRVDQPHLVDAVARGELLGERTTDRTRADDGDE